MFDPQCKLVACPQCRFEGMVSACYPDKPVVNTCNQCGYAWSEVEKEMKKEKDQICVQLEYFKSSGKLYSSACFFTDKDKPLYKIWDEVRKLNCDCELPGLQSGIWRDGFILINVPGHENERPHLIVPIEMRQAVALIDYIKLGLLKG